MRCQPARPGLSPTACRVHRRISTAPAGRPPRHWRGGLVVAAADEGAAAAKALPGSGKAASQPLPAGSWVVPACGPVSIAFSIPPSIATRPGQVRRWLVSGWAHHTTLHSCPARAFVQPGPPLPLPRPAPTVKPLTPAPSSLTHIPTAPSAARTLLQQPPGPALSVSQQVLELQAVIAAQRAELEQVYKGFAMLHGAYVTIKDAARQIEEALQRKLEEAERRAAQQGKATPAPPPPQLTRAPAQRPAPPVWDSATAQASPTAAMSRLRAAEASAAAATAWATTAAAHESAARAATERASSLPAAQHTAGAEEWEWVAAAWQAAYAALGAARQACPDAPAVRQAEAAVAAAAALRGMQQGWCGGDDAGDDV
jgi:hypothetical protein